MMALTDAFATLGVALAVYAGVLSSANKSRDVSLLPPYAKAGLSLLVLLVLTWPALGPISLAAYVRGISSDLSITLVALSAWSLLLRFGYAKPIHPREFAALMWTVAAGALLLYPTALGWGDWDAYRLGWSSWVLWAGLLLLCAASMLTGLVVLPSFVALAMLAWSFGLMESGNLWDYLMDAWLSVFALGYVVSQVFIKCWRNVRHRFS